MHQEDPPGPELEDFVNDPEIRAMYAVSPLWNSKLH